MNRHVIFGTGMIKSRTVIQEALNAGFRRFDTGVIYGNDMILFECIRNADKLTDQLEVIHKAQPYRVREQFEKTIAPHLGSRKLDAFLLHHPFIFFLDNRTSLFASLWREMESLVEEGMVETIGVSNAGISVLQYLQAHANVPPRINQIEFHPLCSDRQLSQYCLDNDIELQAYSPLAGNHLKLLEHPTIRAVASEVERTPAQVCIRWLLEHGVTPVIRTQTPSRMQENLCTTDFSLTASQRARIDALQDDHRLWGDPVKLAGLYGRVDDKRIRVPQQKARFALRSLVHRQVVKAILKHRPKQHLLTGRLYLHMFQDEKKNKLLSTFLWKYVFNMGARLRFLLRSLAYKPLDSHSQALLHDLRQQGFAMTNVDAIGARDLFERMVPTADLHAMAPTGSRLADPIAHALGKNPMVRRIFDEYTGVSTVLQQCGRIAHRSQAQADIRKGNARWHFDIEDFHVLRAFYLLTDVTASSGPLEIVPGTHPHGQYAQAIAEALRHGIPLDDPAPLGIKPASLTGPAGTVILFDARAIHRGGFTSTDCRELAFHTHTAPNWIHPQWLLSMRIAVAFRQRLPLLRALSPWNLLLTPLRWRPKQLSASIVDLLDAWSFRQSKS